VTVENPDAAAPEETKPESAFEVVRPDPYREELLRIEAEITKLDGKIEEQSEALKVLKARREGLITDLRKAVKNSQPGLPFGDGALSTLPVPDADWRQVSLATALQGHVTEKMLEKLAEADLKTVGELGDFCKANRLTDIKGVGEKKAEEIEKALEQFWAERNQCVEKPPQEESPAQEEQPATEPDAQTLAQMDGGD
jgi:hypothetical protein